MNRPIFGFLIVSAVAIAPRSHAADSPDGARWWSHVAVLADDALEGRNTGSVGHKKAAEYVAREFEKAGLKPAGTEGYLQAVKFKSREIDEPNCSLALVRKDGTESLALGDDAVISLRVDPSPTIDAELVFAATDWRSRRRGSTISRTWTPEARSSSISPAPRRPSPGRWRRTCSRPASGRRC